MRSAGGALRVRHGRLPKFTALTFSDSVARGAPYLTDTGGTQCSWIDINCS